MTVYWDLYRAVEDIMINKDFQVLASINHHGNSILDHSFKVCLLSWSLAERLGWDQVSTARGALLHDFFLYDWKVKHSHRKRRFYEIWKMHGFTHPGEALKNGNRHFYLNSREKDIILRHMFPLTLIPPRYRESWLVNLCDKWVSLREISLYVSYLADKGKRKGHSL